MFVLLHFLSNRTVSVCIYEFPSLWQKFNTVLISFSLNNKLASFFKLNDHKR